MVPVTVIIIEFVYILRNILNLVFHDININSNVMSCCMYTKLLVINFKTRLSFCYIAMLSVNQLEKLLSLFTEDIQQLSFGKIVEKLWNTFAKDS